MASDNNKEKEFSEYVDKPLRLKRTNIGNVSSDELKQASSREVQKLIERFRKWQNSHG